MKRILSAIPALALMGLLALVGAAPASAATSRACKQAAATANILVKKARDLKRVAAKMGKAIKGGKLDKLHKAARKLQKPIVQTYSSHFQQPDFLTKWTQHRLKRADVIRSFRKIFVSFKGDWTKLRKGGYKNFNKIKSGGFKLPKKTALPRRFRDGAPCGLDSDDADQDDAAPSACWKAKKVHKATKAAKGYSSKKWSKMSKYFTKGKLQKLDKIRAFLKKFSKAAIRNSITKTKAAIAEGKRILRLRRQFRRLKSDVARYKRLLSSQVRRCKRSKRKRTSIDRSPVGTRKCGEDASSSHTPVCWECSAFGGALGSAQNALADPLVGSFEGNFQTANSWVETDDAYNTGATSADAACGLPGL